MRSPASAARGLWAVLVLCAMLPACGTAAAAPTGLNLIPTADMLEAGTASLEIERDGYPGLFRSDCESYLLFQAGLTDRLEAGFDLYHSGGSTCPALNAKYLLAPEGRLPAVAAGILEVGKGLRPVSYIVLSSDAGIFRLHGGAARSAGSTHALVGGEYELRRGLYLLADWQAGDEGYASAGFYIENPAGTGLDVAVGFPNSRGEPNLLIVNVLRRFALR